MTRSCVSVRGELCVKCSRRAEAAERASPQSARAPISSRSARPSDEESLVSLSTVSWRLSWPGAVRVSRAMLVHRDANTGGSKAEPGRRTSKDHKWSHQLSPQPAAVAPGESEWHRGMRVAVNLAVGVGARFAASRSPGVPESRSPGPQSAAARQLGRASPVSHWSGPQHSSTLNFQVSSLLPSRGWTAERSGLHRCRDSMRTASPSSYRSRCWSFRRPPSARAARSGCCRC